MRLGLDIGSTTIKCVVLDEDNKLIYSTYERHYSQITDKIAELLDRVRREIDGADKALVALSGSAGMGVAQDCGIDFVQEVYATRVAANTFIPGTDVVIELGGEDAKILFLTNGLEVRMNGTCAGGTGAFIDQMATLLNVPLEEMDDLAKQYEKTYTIASRCGVFAKTDIQPLLNQGARKSDIAESIFNAVVSQTVAGLAQGREIEGQIVYLGGPLTFMSELRNGGQKLPRLGQLRLQSAALYQQGRVRELLPAPLKGGRKAEGAQGLQGQGIYRNGRRLNHRQGRSAQLRR